MGLAWMSWKDSGECTWKQVHCMGVHCFGCPSLERWLWRQCSARGTVTFGVPDQVSNSNGVPGVGVGDALADRCLCAHLEVRVTRADFVCRRWTRDAEMVSYPCGGSQVASCSK